MDSRLTNNVQVIKEWYQKVIDACNHHDSVVAFSVLRQWDEMFEVLPEQQKNEIVRFKEKLLFTAFPELPLNQAVEVIEKKLLNILRGEVDIEEIIHKRFLYLGYGNQDGDRVAFKNATLKNQQLLGGKKIFEWLQAFDRAFPLEGFQEAASGKFFTQTPDVINLSKSDQAVLRLLLRVYDEQLRAPIMTIYDTIAVYKRLVELEKAGVKEINPKTFEVQYMSPPGSIRNNGGFKSGSREKTLPQQSISLPLLPALSKFENLGNQLITNERIRVKSQQEPVRPSLLYWLKYYRDELGIGQHNSVECGDFLFRSENGRKLSPEERERISLILKSLEESLPLSIDTERQEIIFPAFQGVLMESHNEMRSPTLVTSLSENPSEPFRKVMQERGIPSGAPANNWQNSPKPVQNSIGGPARNATRSDAPARSSYANSVADGGGMSFSAGHIFPAEKEVISQKTTPAIPFAVPTPSFRSAPTKKAFDDSNPFIIHPSKEEEIS